jgi:hypothetical protein
MDGRVAPCQVVCIMKALLIFPCLALPMLHAAEPTVTLAGIQVVMDDGAEDFDGFRTFNMEKGHNVALIVRSDGKTMVGFDEDKATITLGGAKTECSFFSNMAFSDDRKALKLEFRATDPVATDAQGSFKVAGTLPVVLASGKEEIRSAAFGVKKGTKVQFPDGAKGMPTLEVKSTGKPDFGHAEFEIEFSTNRKIDEFAGFRFYTKDGKPVEAERGGSSWMGFGNKGSGSVSYRFKAKQTDLILAVENWTGSEEVSLKVDFSAGLGGVGK